MALVALWASTLSEEDLANWFGYDTGGIVETAEVPPPDILPTTAPIENLAETAPVAEPEVEVASAAPESTLPQVRETVLGRVLSPAEADRIYAATGVWQRAPRLPLEPTTSTLTAALPILANTEASVPQPALPQVVDQLPDLAFLTPMNPPAFGRDFDRDADGFILATAQGAMTPQGAFVIAGPPPKKPPKRQAVVVPTVQPVLPDAPDGVILISGRPSRCRHCALRMPTCPTCLTRQNRRYTIASVCGFPPETASRRIGPRTARNPRSCDCSGLQGVRNHGPQDWPPRHRPNPPDLT